MPLPCPLLGLGSGGEQRERVCMQSSSFPAGRIHRLPRGDRERVAHSCHYNKIATSETTTTEPQIAILAV